ncbi:hypothetical protein CO652_02840 [Rhizobium sp. H4]|nr:hypothetical protein CO652_02840 [Rhizobium sp. H4]
MPCGPLIRPFGPPTGVEPRVSTRPSDPRWGEEGEPNRDGRPIKKSSSSPRWPFRSCRSRRGRPPLRRCCAG